MAQALLQWHRADFAQKRRLGIFLHPRQLRIGFNVADFELLLIKRIGAPTKDRVVDETHAAKRLGQNLLLLRRWVKAVFVGAFSHISQNKKINVDGKQLEDSRGNRGVLRTPRYPSPAQKAGVSLARQMKKG